MDWEECSISGMEFATERGLQFWCGDDGNTENPIFGSIVLRGECKELYRGKDIGEAKAACQSRLERSNDES